MNYRHALKKLVHNPWVDVVVGLTLALSGLWETWQTISQDLLAGHLKAGHGVALFGIITALRAIADIFGGLEFLDEAEYTKKPD